MNRKISLLLTMIMIQGWMSETYAQTSQDGGYCRKKLFWYLGLSGGGEQLMGRRSEGLIEPTGTTEYTSAKPMFSNNAIVSLIGGFLWKFPPLPVLIGVEGYFGRGNNLSSVRDVRPDGAGNSRFYGTDFLRKYAYGGSVRVGYVYCEDNYVYAALGIDQSKFTTTRSLTNQPNTSLSNLIQRTRQFNGISLAAGFEKYFGHFLVGLEVKTIQYKRQLTSDIVIVGGAKRDMYFHPRPIIYSGHLRMGYRF